MPERLYGLAENPSSPAPFALALSERQDMGVRSTVSTPIARVGRAPREPDLWSQRHLCAAMRQLGFVRSTGRRAVNAVAPRGYVTR